MMAAQDAQDISKADLALSQAIVAACLNVADALEKEFESAVNHPGEMRNFQYARGWITPVLKTRDIPLTPDAYTIALAWLVDWGMVQTPATRTGFTITSKISALEDKLLAAGMITREGKAFKWTDKIGPVMILANLWDAELEGLNDLSAAHYALTPEQRQASGQARVGEMPDDIREQIIAHFPKHRSPHPASDCLVPFYVDGLWCLPKEMPKKDWSSGRRYRLQVSFGHGLGSAIVKVLQGNLI